MYVSANFSDSSNEKKSSCTLPLTNRKCSKRRRKLEYGCDLINQRGDYKEPQTLTIKYSKFDNNDI